MKEELEKLKKALQEGLTRVNNNETTTNVEAIKASAELDSFLKNNINYPNEKFLKEISIAQQSLYIATRDTCYRSVEDFSTESFTSIIEYVIGIIDIEINSEIQSSKERIEVGEDR